MDSLQISILNENKIIDIKMRKQCRKIQCDIFNLKYKKKEKKLNCKEKDSKKIELPIFKYGLIFHVLYLLAYITIFLLKNDPILFIFGF